MGQCALLSWRQVSYVAFLGRSMYVEKYYLSTDRK